MSPGLNKLHHLTDRCLLHCVFYLQQRGTWDWVTWSSH